MKISIIIFLSLISLSLFSQNGTPVSTPYTPTKQYFIYALKTGTAAQDSKKILIINDTSSYHLMMGHIYMDSMPVLKSLGNSSYMINIDSVTGRVGFSKWDQLKISSTAITSALGYTPLASYTETDPLFNTKLATKSTTDLTEGINLYFTNARARSAITLTTTGAGAATYVSGALNIPTPVGAITPTYNYSVTRPVNSTSFTPSSTQPYRVYYNVEISCTATIGGTASGSVVLQYYNGSTWVNTAGTVKNSNTVSLAIVLNSATIQGGTISGEFPANTQLRLVSTSTGTTTITYNTGSEILY